MTSVQSRGQTVSVLSPSGETFGAYFAEPNLAQAPGLVLLQYICGVNQVMMNLADQFASAGYLTIVPDLFWRQEPGVRLMDDPAKPTPAEWKRALELNQGFDDEAAIADLRAALSFVRNHPRCNGRAGSLGYCLGGRMAWLMATHTDSDCNVGYYGVNLDRRVGDAQRIQRPLLLHVAGRDDLVPETSIQTIVGALRVVSHAQVTIHGGVNHAFALPRGPNWSADAAASANAASMQFLARHLQASMAN